jgi:hypothetical protein
LIRVEHGDLREQGLQGRTSAVNLKKMSDANGEGRVWQQLCSRASMVFRVNYNSQRAERNRAKAAKVEAKLRKQEEETARRKAEREPRPAEPPKTDTDEGAT